MCVGEEEEGYYSSGKSLHRDLGMGESWYLQVWLRSHEQRRGGGA